VGPQGAVCVTAAARSSLDWMWLFLLFSERPLIIQLAARHRLPAVYETRLFPEAGGLLAYGPLPQERFQRMAVYVDRILRGARPGELPVEQPTKFELVINLKTAKALGLTIPQSLLLRADQVIAVVWGGDQPVGIGASAHQHSTRVSSPRAPSRALRGGPLRSHRRADLRGDSGHANDSPIAVLCISSIRSNAGRLDLVTNNRQEWTGMNPPTSATGTGWERRGGQSKEQRGSHSCTLR